MNIGTPRHWIGAKIPISDNPKFLLWQYFEHAEKERPVDFESPSEPVDSGEADEESNEYYDEDDELRSPQVLETVLEIPGEESADENSSEEQESEESQTNKPIVIKPCAPSNYGEKLKALENEAQVPPLQVLQPDAIADLKRELARKGIIEGYEEEIDGAENPSDTEHPPQPVPVVTSADLVRDGTPDDEDMDQPQDDKRDGYKTNKSFEIRRLQAKAEREKEAKQRMFFMPKFLKSSKVASEKSKNAKKEESLIADEHRKTWIRKKPKSILKPQTPTSLSRPETPDGDSKIKHKSATIVRIREPEYDYNEYTDLDTETVSEDPPSQSSSVLGYRPNSATSLSTFGSSSLTDDVSLNSEYFSQPNRDWEDEDWFYRYSSHGMTVHDLYDEIDQINPSRMAGFRLPTTPDTPGFRSKPRERSATNSAWARSSFHVLGDSRYNQREREALHSASRSNRLPPNTYEDKPLHLFDAMRYDRNLAPRPKQSKEMGYDKQLKRARGPQDEGKHQRESFRPESLGQAGLGVYKGKISKRRQERPGSNSFPNGAITFGPNIVPIPHKTENRPDSIPETEWVDRVQKFFATAYAGKQKQVEQRKKLRKFHFGRKFFRRSKKSKTTKRKALKSRGGGVIMPALCLLCGFSDCCCVGCARNPTSVLCAVLFLPTVVITSVLLMAVFWAVGILPV